MKIDLLFTNIFLLFFVCASYAQNERIFNKPKAKDSICRDYFLRHQISHSPNYSNSLIIPVNIENDPYRILIKSDYFHRYMTVLAATQEKEINDTSLLDSISYLNKTLDIINKKEKYSFNINTFELFVKDGSFIILDKPNPYSKEIKKFGLEKFIKNRFSKDFITKGNYTLYQLIYKPEYGKPNEYNLNYLIEALFDYNFKFDRGDLSLGFIKVSCPSND